MALSGVTYYKLNRIYSGDKTKGCGLIGAEIDDNFYFLRGYDIIDAMWDQKRNAIVLKRVNGGEILIDADSLTPIIKAGATYDAENGVLTISLNGDSVSVSGFSTCNCTQIWDAISVLQNRIDDLECKVDQALEYSTEALDKVKEYDGEIERLDNRITDDYNYLNWRIDNAEISGGSPTWIVIDD